MKWSIRSKIAAMTLAASPVLLAASANAGDSDKSVVKVAIAPFDTMVPNIQHLARLGGGGFAAGTVKTALTEYTAGLDTSRPMGVFVELDEYGNPAPVAALPLKDLEIFFGQLAIFGEPEDLGDGLYELNLGNSIYMKNSGEWLLVGQTEDAVLNFDISATKTLKPLVAKYDVLVDLNPRNIPQPLIEMLFSQYDAGVEQAMTDMDEEQAEEALKSADQVKEQLQEFLDSTEALKIGLAVNKAESKTTLDFGSRFVEGSKLALNLAKMKGSKAVLAGVPQESSMMMLQSLQLVASEDIAQIETAMEAAVKAAVDQIDDGDVAEKAKEYLTQLADLFVETAKKGQLETVADITTSPYLNIAAAFNVADGSKVEAIAANAAKDLAPLGDQISLKVNTGKHAGANLHQLSIALPPNADEKVVAIFGKRVTATLATTPTAVFVSIGKDCESNVKKVVDRAMAKPSAAGEAVKMRFSLGQLLSFMKSIETNPGLDAAVEVTSAGKDQIMIDSKNEGRDAVVRVTLEDNVIKAVSASMTAGGGGF
ncbi:hypothetical protein SH449x_002316 [Pirellulaceae bacterium SH449]